MMREIKFRAKHNGKEGEWWYCTTDKNNINWKKRIREPYYFFQLLRDYILNKDTLGQYTGFKDKNGVEIFEGDILRVYFMNTGDTEIRHQDREVKYNKDKARFEPEFYLDEEKQTLYKADIGGSGYRKYQIEIIGNIYETPELI